MRRVLITGSSRGIGLATAKKFLNEGWQVLGASTKTNDVIKHNNYKHYLLDLNNPESINICTNKILKDNSQIDVLINCAGISFEPDESTKFSVLALRKDLEVNLIGTINFTEKIIPIIKASGQILAVSSMMSSLVGYTEDDYPAYRISKTALNMYIKTLAHRLKSITVSAFDPGWVKTDMGGSDATREPEIPANEIYALMNTKHKTGQFWFEGKIRSW